MGWLKDTFVKYNVEPIKNNVFGEEGFRAMGQGAMADKIWGKRGVTVQPDNFDKNAALQREFAQNGIRWKVNDARMAGIHPVYAIGASGASFSPMYSAGGESHDTSSAEILSSVGQNVARAAFSTQTQAEKESTALHLQTQRANLEGQQIDNAIRLHQLQQIQGSGVPGPGSSFNVPGQTQSGVAVQEKPFVRVKSAKGMPGTEAGASPGRGMYLTDDGTLVPVPSKDTKEAIEDNFYHETSHFLRNNILPNLTGGNPPPGYHWSWRHQGYRKGPVPYYQKDLRDMKGRR